MPIAQEQEVQLRISTRTEGGAEVDRLGVSVEDLGKDLVAVTEATRSAAQSQQAARDAWSAGKARVDDLKVSLLSAQNEFKFLNARAKEAGAGQAIFAQQAAAAKAKVSDLQSSVRIARAEVRGLGDAHRSAAAQTRQLTAEQDRLSAAMRRSNADTVGATTAAAGLQARMSSVAAAVGGVFAASQIPNLARGLGETADLYSNLNARLSLVNEKQSGFNVTIADTSELARRTHTPLEATTDLMASLARAGEGLGLGQSQVLRLTETINKANQVAGGSSQASEAAVRQLIQGLQSGVLRGDEFNSVMEQSPRLARAMADGLGVPVGALRGMAEDGELTAERIIKAMQSQASAIDAEFARLPLTIGRSITDLSTNWTEFIGEMDKGSGASASVAKMIQAVGENLDTLAKIATTAGEVFIASLAVKAAGSVRTFVIEALAAARASAGMAVATNASAAASTRSAAALATEAAAIRVKYAAQSAGAGSAAAATGAFATGARVAAGAGGALLAGVGRLALGFGPLGLALLATEAAVHLLSKGEKDRAAAAEANSKAVETAIKQEAAAQEALAERTRLVATEAEAARFKLSDLQSDFMAAMENGKGAGEALADVLKRADLGSPDGIKNMAADLDQLKASALVTGEQIQTGLVDRLSQLPSSDLADFGIMAEMAFNRGELSAARFSSVMDAQLRASLKGMGIDADVALGGMSEKFTQLTTNLQIVAVQYDRLRASGRDAGAVLQQAMDAALKGASNPKELSYLTNEVVRLGREGQLAQPKVAGMLEQIKAKALDAVPSIKAVQAEFANLVKEVSKPIKGGADTKSPLSLLDASMAASKATSSAAQAANATGADAQKQSEAALENARQAGELLKALKAQQDALPAEQRNYNERDYGQIAKQIEAAANSAAVTQAGAVNPAVAQTSELIKQVQNEANNLTMNMNNAPALGSIGQVKSEVASLNAELDLINGKTVTVTTVRREVLEGGVPASGLSVDEFERRLEREALAKGSY